jgi:hypothetical protein
LGGGVARGLTPAPSVLTPLDEVVSVWQSGPIVVSRFLLGNRSQSPFAIDFDLLYDVDASHGTIRIPWFVNGNQKSDSKLDSKEGKRLILLGIFRKLAFYQLNYSRSFIRLKYRRITAFTARVIFRESENPDSTVHPKALCFQSTLGE